MWGDEKFRRLSAPKPNAQTLWFYLLTGEHTTALPGAFVAGEAALAEALEWPLPAFKKAFDEVLVLGLAEVDRKARLVFIPKALRHNPPQSPNVVKAWRKAFNELPDCKLKETIFKSVIDFLESSGLGEAYTKAFGEAFEYAFAESEQEQNRNRTDIPPKSPLQGDTSPPVLVFGEFQHVRLTPVEYEKLKLHLNGHTDDYINRLDRWGEEQPRKFAQRKSHYATILTWADRDVKDGKLKLKTANKQPTFYG